MSIPESLPASHEEQPKVLELIKSVNKPGEVAFCIDPYARGIDVVETLMHINPDINGFRSNMAQMLKWATEKTDALKDRELLIEDMSEPISDQVRINRYIQFGKKPTYLDVQQAITEAYGEEHAMQAEMKLLALLVDQGFCALLNPVFFYKNPVATAALNGIVVEMDNMAKEFGTDPTDS